jgi:aryl-alcohol dehydrogenase-like predicted oxidoreductase
MDQRCGVRYRPTMSRYAKLGLGTVQWGMVYGITNGSGQTTFAEVGNILQIAKNHGITLLDTAYAYGEAETVLGGQNVATQGFRVVTKTLSLTSADISVQDTALVSTAFVTSLQRLRCAQVYGLLIHQADHLTMSGGDRLWGTLETLKAKRMVQKIGVSVYHPHQVERILERYRIDLIQLPFNIYDQRFSKTGLLRKLRQAGVEVHVRSAFLQGLLLVPPDRLPERFNIIRDHHARFYSQIYESGLTPVEACLRFCLDQADIDQVIVGCETAEQLVEILATVKKEHIGLQGPESYSVSDDSIIDPSRWST